MCSWNSFCHISSKSILLFWHNTFTCFVCNSALFDPSFTTVFILASYDIENLYWERWKLLMWFVFSVFYYFITVLYIFMSTFGKLCVSQWCTLSLQASAAWFYWTCECMSSHCCTLWVYQFPQCVTTPYFPQDGTSVTAQPEVIVVPLIQVKVEREQESTSSTPPPPLVPAGTASPELVTSNLAFPTLDDFIPPHLQKGSNPSSPNFSISNSLPSCSPPPSPVPPVTEGSHRVSELDNSGAILHTVSCWYLRYVLTT